jgi:catechol 2,3-dioxygenase-like lactoylglutathione lyase family enzyme
MNKFHVSLYTADIDAAVATYKKILGVEPAKVRHDFAKFELEDPPVVLSVNLGGTPGTLSHLGIRYPATGQVVTEMVRTKNEKVDLLEQQGTTCCYAKSDKYWVRDADGVPWEMYTLLADAEPETAADEQLRALLGQGEAPSLAPAGCCVPAESR